jgi:hypothetical protein
MKKAWEQVVFEQSDDIMGTIDGFRVDLVKGLICCKINSSLRSGDFHWHEFSIERLPS